MKADHRPSVLRRCAHCGHPFVVNPRRRKRHRFCSDPTCAQASKRAAQKKWLEKWRKEHGGVSYFSGKERAYKVRNWRRLNPQYRKRTRLREGAPGGLRLSGKLKAALRSVALQDTIDPHLALVIGVISRLSGAVLQDMMARELRATMLCGYAILRGQTITQAPWALPPAVQGGAHSRGRSRQK